MAYLNPKFAPEDKTTDLEKQQNQWKTLLLSQRKQMPETGGYRRWSNEIQQGGLDATNYQTKLRNKREAQQLEAQRQAMMNQTMRNISVSTGDNGYQGFSGQGAPKGSFAAFMAAIGEHESSNNYKARNRDSGAMGKYQIMPGNLGGKHSGWDYEALGYDVSPNQFMNSPQLQDAIARYKLQQYYSKYGARGAAVAWYAGPGALKYGSGTLNKKQGAYSSINQYANSILRRLGLL